MNCLRLQTEARVLQGRLQPKKNIQLRSASAKAPLIEIPFLISAQAGNRWLDLRLKPVVIHKK
jgi:hypothetical protein